MVIPLTTFGPTTLPDYTHYGDLHATLHTSTIGYVPRFDIPYTSLLHSHSVFVLVLTNYVTVGPFIPLAHFADLI